MFKFIKRLPLNEAGATAIEYALIAALVGVAIIAGASTLGTSISKAFDELAAKIDASVTCEEVDTDGNCVE